MIPLVTEDAARALERQLAAGSGDIAMRRLSLRDVDAVLSQAESAHQRLAYARRELEAALASTEEALRDSNNTPAWRERRPDWFRCIAHLWNDPRRAHRVLTEALATLAGLEDGTWDRRYAGGLPDLLVALDATDAAIPTEMIDRLRARKVELEREEERRLNPGPIRRYRLTRGTHRIRSKSGEVRTFREGGVIELTEAAAERMGARVELINGEEERHRREDSP